MVGLPPSRWPAEEARRILRELRRTASGDPQGSLQAYVGSPVPVLGLRMVPLRRIALEASRSLRDRPLVDARTLARRLWAGESFEEKIVAVELLRRRPLVGDTAAFSSACRWVDSATGWGLSDSLAAGPLATEFYRRGDRSFPELLRWARSPNLWRRRASTYALNGWVRAGELDRPFELLERLLDDPERWVQRAVGTWLRECWKKDRGRTERFLRNHVRRLPPTVITVATERASVRFRSELRQAARRDAARPRA